MSKKVLIALFERLAPASDTPTKERDLILVPYKFIAYTVCPLGLAPRSVQGFNPSHQRPGRLGTQFVAGAAAYTAPGVFDWLGINLEHLHCP